MTESTPELADIVRALSGKGIVTQHESEFQDKVARLLAEASVSFEPEVRLSPQDRIDFLVGRVGVELKVQGTFAAVLRQLHRYAQSDRIDHLVLVSTVRKLACMPPDVGGKGVTVIIMGGGL